MLRHGGKGELLRRSVFLALLALHLSTAQNVTSGFGAIQHVSLRTEFNRTFLTLPGTIAAGGWICYTMELDNPTLRTVTYWEQPKIFARLEPALGAPRLSASVYGCPSSTGSRRVWEYYSPTMKQQLETSGQTLQEDWQWKGDVQTLSIDATHRTYYWEVTSVDAAEGPAAFRITFDAFDALNTTINAMYPTKNAANWNKNIERVQPDVGTGRSLTGAPVLDSTTVKDVAVDVGLKWYPPGLDGVDRRMLSVTNGTNGTNGTAAVATPFNSSASNESFWTVEFENQTMTTLQVAQLYEYAVFIMEITPRVGKEPGWQGTERLRGQFNVRPGGCCTAPPLIEQVVADACPPIRYDGDNYVVGGSCRSSSYDYSRCADNTCDDFKGGTSEQMVAKGSCVSCPFQYPDCPKEFTTFCESLTFNVTELKKAMNASGTPWDQHIKDSKYLTLWTQGGLELHAGRVQASGNFSGETPAKRREARGLSTRASVVDLLVLPSPCQFPHQVSEEEWALVEGRASSLTADNASRFWTASDVTWLRVPLEYNDSNASNLPTLQVARDGSVKLSVFGLNQSDNNVYAFNVMSRRLSTNETAVHQFFTMQLRTPRYTEPTLTADEMFIFIVVGASLVTAILVFVGLAVWLGMRKRARMKAEKDEIARNAKHVASEMTFERKNA